MPLSHVGFYLFDEFELNPAKRMLRREGRPVALSPKAFEVLTYLVINPGRVVTKEELLKAVWPESFVEESNLAQHISGLRKAFSNRAEIILTVPGRGYQFAADVRHESRTDTAATTQSGDMLVQRVLERTHIVMEESSRVTKPVAANRVWVWAAVGIVAAAAAGWAGWRWSQRVVSGDHHEIVLADFENTTGDPEFDRALNTALSVDLKQSPFLLIASAAKRQATMKLMEHSPQETLTPTLARELCQRINDQAVVSGMIAKFGQKYLVTLTATDCESGDDLTQSKAVAEDRDGVLQAMDTVAAEMRRHLGEPLKSIHRFSRPLLAKTTNSLDALKAYTQAHDLGVQGKFRESIPFFEKAIELDPKFAIAYGDLGVVYNNLGEYDLGTANLKKSYELKEYAVEQDELAIVSNYNADVTGDLNEGIRNFETWSEMYPQASAPNNNLANLETQIGRPELALEPASRGVALSPADPVSYTVLARAQLHAGMIDEAKATCQKAMTLKIDDASIHGLLLEAAFEQHDQADVDAQVAWAKGTPAEPYMQVEKARSEFVQGRVRDAEKDFAQLTEGYRKQGMTERANRMLGGMPRIELELGLVDSARGQLRALPPIDGSTDIPVAMAKAGELLQAEAVLQREMQKHPTDTLWQNDSGPQIRAALAIAEKKPDEAIRALQPSIPYDLRTFDIPGLRGEAYLEAKQPGLAEVEFNKILNHPGVEPLSPNFPLAHLGLARAYSMENRNSESRKEYEALFTFWKDADSDLPVLKQARVEYARLGGSDR